MSTELLFPVLKVLHISALVFWLGPTLGSWWILQMGRQAWGEEHATTRVLYYLFLKTLWIEHMALGLLLATGVAMGAIYYGLDTPWLRTKLLLIGVVLLPLEIMDIWLGHVQLPKLFAHRAPNAPFSEREHELLKFYHRCFTPLALAIMPPAIIAILWLAVARPM